MKLQCADKTLDLSSTVVMGVLNITPDSFSDGGTFFSNNLPDLDLIYNHALAMINAGAEIIDVGGESTRPGAIALSEQQEMDRVLPVIDKLKDLPAVLSVDTSSPALMQKSIEMGVGIINDVRALDRVKDLDFLADSDVCISLMHMQGQPQTMQEKPNYLNVVQDVSDFLRTKIERCKHAGICKTRLIIDPGFGFGKTLAHNLALLRALHDFQDLGFPILAGLSRKSMIGQIIDKEVPSDRVIGSVAAALVAAQNGANILRVHDVDETVDALKVLSAVSS